ncbi:MAG: sodium:proton antiporter [Nocardioides sp.]|uniref:DUF6328 family protein n=1 Tax=Nocardioides sp. TaxID=35761 RepID=UPI00261A1289|nr:DUF6328 family protein [Nocardioides sp.]MCW2834611.1 sodium:proton antiporter [Nocardioides sp.]
MNETKDSRDETPDERADRNWADLMQELRVSQTGVQLLAAFLVTLPFQSRFTELDTFQQRWYLGLLALAFLTVGVTLSPVAIHRHLFQGGSKPDVVRAAHVMTGLALGLISLLLAGISFLVVDVVLSRGAAAVGGGLALLVALSLLVVIPRVVAHKAGQST